MISRDISLLCPQFRSQVVVFQVKLAEAKLLFYLFEGLRTFDQSDEYYAKGRTAPGGIVTNAKGGDSWHNYGLAADFVLAGSMTKPGVQWSWDTKSDANADGRNDWMQMGAIAVSCGLEWGGNWTKFPDLPHVQNRFGLNLADAKELYRLGGIQRVWAACRA